MQIFIDAIILVTVYHFLQLFIYSFLILADPALYNFSPKKACELINHL